jgi:hypothetical protein
MEYTSDSVLEETAELLRSLRGVWDETAVDDLDHALQAATPAIEHGASPQCPCGLGAVLEPISR